MDKVCATCKHWFPNTKEVLKMYRRFASYGQCERDGEMMTADGSCKHHETSELTVEDWYFNGTNGDDDISV